MFRITRFTLLILFITSISFGLANDRKDEALYQTKKNFYNKDKEYLVTDFTPYEHIRDIEVYHPVLHTTPIRQDTTNTCWCFCTTSFLESELIRLGRGEIKLSRMYTVYWEYVEKVRLFVQSKGKTLVAEGSQPNAVINRMKQYGAVPANDYTGLLGEAQIHDHRTLHRNVTQYLEYVKEQKIWYEDQVLTNLRLILNRFLGSPPETITVNEEQMTPREYMDTVLQLPLDDYVSVISFKKISFWSKDAYAVPDNWWNSKDYFNVPLDRFYEGIKGAIKKGYSVVIAGDVSEPGKYGWHDIAIVPTFDIPSQYINQDSRELRFFNKTSTDDHGLHLIGYKRVKGIDWFLVKDSASSAWRGEFPGYHFFHQDYIKLKILAFLTHKDAVPELMSNFSD